MPTAVAAFWPVKRVCAGLAIAAAAFASPGARAQDPSSPVALAWSAPVECPSRDAVLAEIARVLETSSSPRGPASARVEVTREAADLWHASLTVDARSARTERAFDAESCAAIASATALIVAVAIDGRWPEPALQAAAASAPFERAARTEPPSALNHRTMFSELEIGFAGLVDVRTLPTVAPGGELLVGWTARVSGWRLRVLASAQLFPRSPQFQHDSSGNGGYFGFLAASGIFCASRIVTGRLDVGPCLGAQGDYMGAWSEQGTAKDFQGQPNGAWWPDLSGSLLGSLTLSDHVTLFARLDGLVPLGAYPRFAIAERETPGSGTFVYQPAAGPKLRAALGLELRIF